MYHLKFAGMNSKLQQGGVSPSQIADLRCTTIKRISERLIDGPVGTGSSHETGIPIIGEGDTSFFQRVIDLAPCAHNLVFPFLDA